MEGSCGIISGMGKELKPTLWRTARALANADRLNLMRLVSNAKGAKSVSELAEEIGLPVPTTSLYLRALNARGLISVVRSGRCVYYGTGSDRSLPVAMSIQNSFRKLFALQALPFDWTDRLLPVLRAYSSPRREEIIRILSNHPRLSYSELRRRCGICETTFLRHFSILTSIGLAVVSQDGTYAIAKPKNSLEAALLAASQ